MLGAQVIGMPDEKYGEEICAWVRLNSQSTATAHELQQWCQGAIADFKIPRYWKFVDSYPLTASGKVQKFLMRQCNLQDVTDCGKLYDKAQTAANSTYSK